MRAVKLALVTFALIATATAAYTGYYFHSCLGRMSECYASFRSARSGVDRSTQERLQSIHAGFTASEERVAFPVPLGEGANGIILIAPETDRVGLIATSGYSHWSPQLSSDGKRLVFVRGASSGGDRELVTCDIGSWRCSVLFRTSRQLVTPFDIGNGFVLFATNQPREGDDAKSRRFDIFSVRKGQKPTQLTNYEMFGVQSLSATKDRIVFGAEGKRGFEPSSCPPADSFKCDKSEIYALDFDPEQMKILNKPPLLKPLFTVAGHSVGPMISSDGKRVAFRNTNRQGNPWRYNLVVSDVSGTVEAGFAVQGNAFSSSAFVGNFLFVNEVFADHYRFVRIDLPSERVSGYRVEHSPEYLKTVEPINLSVDGLASAL